jgi:hypothetical protein
MNKLQLSTEDLLVREPVNAIQIVGIIPTKKEGSDGMNILAIPYNTASARGRADGKTIHFNASNIAKKWVALSEFGALKVREGEYLEDGPDYIRAMANKLVLMDGKEALAERFYAKLDSNKLIDLNTCLAKFKKAPKGKSKYGDEILGGSTKLLPWLVYGYQIVPMWFFERPEGWNESIKPMSFEYNDPNVPGVVRVGKGFCRNYIMTEDHAAYVKQFKLVNMQEEEVAAAIAKEIGA